VKLEPAAAVHTTQQLRSVLRTQPWLCGSIDLPAENIFLNAVLHVFPRLQFHRPGIDRRDSATNFLLPRRVGVRVGGTVQARENLDGQFGMLIRAEAQSIGMCGFGCSRHAGNSTSSHAAEQPDRPVGRYRTAVGVIVLGGTAVATILGAIVIWRGVRRDSIFAAKRIIFGVLIVMLASLLAFAWPTVVAEKRCEATRTGASDGARQPDQAPPARTARKDGTTSATEP
jgi:hypothetical protein